MFFWCAAAPVRGAGFLKSTGEQVFAESSTVVVKRPMPVEALPRPWLSLANSPNMSKAEVWLLNDYYRHTPTVNKTYARAIIQFDTCRFVFYVHDLQLCAVTFIDKFEFVRLFSVGLNRGLLHGVCHSGSSADLI